MRAEQRSTALALYLAALAQGLTVVSVPASASVLKLALDDAQYGASFVPQMLATIAGSLLASRLGERALRGRVLAAALVSSAAAQVLLALVPYGGGFGCMLAATAAVGFGFGLSAAALNTLPARLFPQRAASALVALHTFIAGGFAAGPALASLAIEARRWLLFPACVAGLLLLLAAAAIVWLPAAPAREERVPEQRTAAASGAPATLFSIIAVCYALAEGTFANWAVVYLREERGVSQAGAALALSTFWLALAAGRLLATALLTRVAAVTLWRALPLLMALAFLALPGVRDATGGVLAFGGAGLACSAFFPLTVSLAAPSFSGGAARASSLLTAALMIGVGLGSFAIGPLRAGAPLAQLYQWSCAYPLLAWALCLLAAARGGRSPLPREQAAL